MADRKVTVEVTDNKSLDGLLKKVDALNTALAKTEALGKSVRVGGSVAAGKALGSTGVPADEFGQYRNARAAVGTGAAGRDFARQAQGLGGLVHIYATFAANIFAVGAAFNALKKAMDFTIMQASLTNLSVSIGTNLKTISDEMVKVTNGAIAMQEAMKFTAMASTAGMTAKQIRDLTTAAKGASAALGRDLADAMDRMFRGVVKMEPELLDELGIMTKANDAYKEYGRSVGKAVESLTSFEKRMAFTNAVIAEAQQKFGALSGKVDVNAYSKALAQLQNVAMSIGGAINSIIGPIVNLFGESKALMAGFITAITALLLKQAVPALTSWRTNLKETAEASDNAFKRMVQNARDGAANYASAFSKAAGAAQEKVQKTLEATRSANLENLKESVSASFKGGKFLNEMKQQVSLQDALVKLKEKEGFIENQLKRAQSARDNSTGEAKTAAINRINHLEVIQRYLKGEHTQLAEIAKLEAEAASWAKQRADAEQNAARAITASAQRKINRAEDRALISKSVSRVGEQAELFGMRAGFQQLGKEITNFNEKKLETGPLSRYENAMRMVGVASLSTKSALTILGTAVMGVASAMMSIFAIVGIFYMALEGLAWATDANSKKIGKFTESSEALVATLEITNKSFKKNREELAAGIATYQQYIAWQERAANALDDIRGRLEEVTDSGKDYLGEGMKRWTATKQWFLEQFGKGTANILSEGLTKSVIQLNAEGKITGRQNIELRKAISDAGLEMSDLVKIAEKLKIITTGASIENRANADAVKSTAEFYKQLTVEGRKHESSAQKLARTTKEVSDQVKNQLDNYEKLSAKGNFADIGAMVQGLVANTDMEQMKRLGGALGKAWAEAAEGAMNAGAQGSLRTIFSSPQFRDLEKYARRYEEADKGTEESGTIYLEYAKAKKELEAKITEEVQRTTDASALAVLKLVTEKLQGITAGNLVQNVVDFKGASLAAGNEATGKGAIEKKLPQATANAAEVFARMMAGGTDNTRFKKEEAFLRLLQERVAAAKLLNDLDAYNIKLAIKRGDTISDDAFAQYSDSLVATARLAGDVLLEQIKLDELKAKKAGEWEAGLFKLRYDNAKQTTDIAMARARAQAEEEKIRSKIEMIDRDAKPQQTRLALLEQYNNTLSKTKTLSTQELATQKALLDYQKAKLDINTEFAKRAANGESDLWIEKEMRLSIIEAEKELSIEMAKQEAISANINAQITARDTLIKNAVDLNNGILTSQQALVAIEQQKASLAEQAARAYLEQVTALGAAATQQDKQRLALAAIAGLQQKNLEYLQQQVVLWDRSGESMKAFEASFGLMIAKTRAEAKGAGVIMAEALNAGIETAVDKMFDTLKEKGRITFKQLASDVGKSIRDSILDGIKTSVKADIKGMVGDLFGIKDPEEEAKNQAIEQFKKSMDVQLKQTSATLENTKAILNETALRIQTLKLDGELNDTMKGLAETNAAQITAIEAQISAMAQFADDISKAIGSMGGKSGGTIGKVMNLFSKVASGYMAGGTQGAVNAGAGAIGGPVGSLLSNGYSIYTGTSAAGSFATNFGLGVYGAEGGTGIGALAGEYAASLLGEGTAGMLASGMSYLAAAMPYIAVALALYQIFGKKGGGPKTGGSFMGAFDATTGQYKNDVTVPGTDNGRFFTPNQSDSEAKKVGLAIGTGYADALRRLGGKPGPGDMEFGAAWDRDPNGTAGNRTSFLVRDSTGKVLYENRDAGAGKSDEELTAALQLESQRSILAALRASDFPEEVASILNSIDIKTATVEDIDKTIKSAIDMSDALTALQNIDIAGLDITKLKSMVVGTETLMQALDRIKAVFDVTARISDQAFGAVGIASYEAREALVKAAGGIQGFAEKMQFFYSAFYSEGENFKYSTTQLNNSLSQLGLTSIPQSKEAFRALMESQDLSTEAGRKLYAQLLNLAPAFDQVVGAIERTSAALGKMNMDAQDQLLLDTLDEQGKYNFWKSRAEELGSDDSFKNLKSPEEIQAKYEAAQNAAMNAWNSMDEQGKKENLAGFQAFLKAILDNANSRLTELGLDATTGPGGTPGAAAAQKTPAEKLVEASTTAAETLAEAFTVGADKIVAALGGTSPSGLTDPSRDALADAVERRARNDEARRAEQDNARGQMDSANAEAMRQAAQTMREAAELIRQGGGEINAAAGRPIQVEVTNNESHVNR